MVLKVDILYLCPMTVSCYRLTLLVFFSLLDSLNRRTIVRAALNTMKSLSILYGSNEVNRESLSEISKVTTISFKWFDDLTMEKNFYINWTEFRRSILPIHFYVVHATGWFTWESITGFRVVRIFQIGNVLLSWQIFVGVNRCDTDF